jgi:hypothetical protein
LRTATYSSVARTSGDLSSQVTRQSVIGSFWICESLALQTKRAIRFELEATANQTHSGLFLRVREARLYSIWTPYGEQIVHNSHKQSDEEAAAFFSLFDTHPVTVEHTVKDGNQDTFLAVTAIEEDALPEPILARPEHYLPEYLLMGSYNKAAALFGEPLG